MTHLETGFLDGSQPLKVDDAFAGYFERRSGRDLRLHRAKSTSGNGVYQAPNISEIERLVSACAGAGLVAAGLLRGRLGGLVLSGLGGALVWRGYTGRCQCYAALGIDTACHNPATAVPAHQGEKVEETITIRRAPKDLYQYWRRLENLPRIIDHLASVETCDELRSHWVAKGPLGKSLEWDAEILNERENEFIAWRSLPGGDIDTAGSIHFRPSRRPGWTDVTLSMKVNPPAGKVGARFAAWIGEGLQQKITGDLQRFKQAMETEKGVRNDSP